MRARSLLVMSMRSQQGGWRLDITANRTATWTRPDGTVHWIGTLIDRPAV